MNSNLTYAVERLQTRLGQTTGYHSTEVLEEALNSLLARSDQDSDPHLLILNALAQSRKKIRRRLKLRATYDLEAEAFRHVTNALTGPSLGYEIEDFLTRGIGGADQVVLTAVAKGADADDLAAQFAIPTARARERLSRARARARILWES